MQILLANAKVMFSPEKIKYKPLTEPMFQSISNTIALEMSQLGTEELAEQLDCGYKLAAENWQRYQNFFESNKFPAIMAYNGQAYKHLQAATLTKEALAFGQRHLWITCFLYGLLRPMDGIVPYRMEHSVRLKATNDKPVSQFWRDKLTDVLIHSVKSDDGILIHLSTAEYEHLFDWNRVYSEIKVIQPLFYVRKNGELKIQAVWAKSCRGAMVRQILQQQLTSINELATFGHAGFVYDNRLGEEAFPHFVREQ